MGNLPLQEYRCSCGKLLFKGSLAFCSVEIKCRRCGLIVSVEQLDGGDFLFIQSDLQGNVEGVFAGVGAPVIDNREYVIGRSLTGLYPYLPHLRDLVLEKGAGSKPYQLRDTASLLRDVESAPVSSLVVPRRRNGVAQGYTIVSWNNTK